MELNLLALINICSVILDRCWEKVNPANTYEAHSRDSFYRHAFQRRQYDAERA